MGLKDYVVPTRTVDLPGGQSMVVRGISFTDLSALILDHAPALLLVFSSVYDKAKEKSLQATDVGKLIQETLSTSPDLIAHIIALAADEPGQIKQAARLPPVTQMEAMRDIIALTFISEAEVKKLVEIVIQGMEQTGDLAASLTSPSKDGSGESGAR